MGIFDNFSLDQFAGGLSTGIGRGSQIAGARNSAQARRKQAENAQKLAEGRLKLQQKQLGLQEDSAALSERRFGLQEEQFRTGQAAAAEDRALSQQDRERKTASDLQRALSIQDAIDAQRRSGGLTEQQIAQIDAAGGAEEQSELLNTLSSTNQAEAANAPLRELQQQELIATIDSTRALADERRRPPAAPEAFTQVRGEQLGLTGGDAEKIFNVSGKTGKVTPIGGGGVTVNTGQKVDQIRQTEQARAGIKRSNTIADELDTLSDTEATISRLQELSPEAAAGLGVPFSGIAKGIESATGIDLPSNVAATEEFQAGSSKLVRDAAKDLKGSLSDKDLELLEKSGPNLLQSREGRDQLLSTISKGNTIKRSRLEEEARLLDQGVTRNEAKKRAKEAFPADGGAPSAAIQQKIGRMTPVQRQQRLEELRAKAGR